MTIKQIIPAPPELRVLYIPKDENGQLCPQNEWTEAIVCLALCHDDEVGDRIVPITPDDCRRDFNGDFAVLETDRFARVVTAEEEKMLGARASIYRQPRRRHDASLGLVNMQVDAR